MSKRIVQGTFFGGEIEPGTFHGGEIEPGTFHHAVCVTTESADGPNTSKPTSESDQDSNSDKQGGDGSNA